VVVGLEIIMVTNDHIGADDSTELALDFVAGSRQTDRRKWAFIID
jgi:hypothetical protein